MTNGEKYAKEILDIACAGHSVAKVNGKITKCARTNCIECDFGGDYYCHEKIAEWANSEYVEQPVDWSKVAVDTPILVRDTKDDEWEPRHFARCENGEVYAWDGGMTSWSAGGDVSKWEYAKLAESEDAYA